MCVCVCVWIYLVRFMQFTSNSSSRRLHARWYASIRPPIKKLSKIVIAFRSFDAIFHQSFINVFMRQSPISSSIFFMLLLGTMLPVFLNIHTRTYTHDSLWPWSFVGADGRFGSLCTVNQHNCSNVKHRFRFG